MASDRKTLQPLLEKIDSQDVTRGIRSDHHSHKMATNTLVIVAVLSCLGNVLWAVHSFRDYRTIPNSGDISLYAGLERDVPLPYRDDTIFANSNRSIADAAWDSWVVDPGIVALSHNWVKAKMLPQAQHWPWDKEKGIYLLNGFHNIHCLVCELEVSLWQTKLSPLSNSYASLSWMLQMAKTLRLVILLSTTCIVSSRFARTRFAMRTTHLDILGTRKRKYQGSCRHVCAEVGTNLRPGPETIPRATVMLAVVSRVSPRSRSTNSALKDTASPPWEFQCPHGSLALAHPVQARDEEAAKSQTSSQRGEILGRVEVSSP